MLDESNARVGQRVQIHPARDEWMQGDMYGEIVKVVPYCATVVVKVKLDKSGRTRGFYLNDIFDVV